MSDEVKHNRIRLMVEAIREVGDSMNSTMDEILLAFGVITMFALHDLAGEQPDDDIHTAMIRAKEIAKLMTMRQSGGMQ